MASVRGEAQVKRGMATAIARLQAASTPAALAMANQVDRGYQERAPRRTGRLAASTDTRATGPGLARFTSGAPYASFVEHGTSDTPAQPALRGAIDNDALTDAAATIMRRAL